MATFPLRRSALAVLSAGALMGTIAHAADVSGQVRGAWVDRQVADAGPLADANRLQPGTAAIEPSAATAQAELRRATTLGAVSLNAIATVQLRKLQGAANTTSDGWFNEAYASGKALGWQWSAGKKVVSWDVGYGFRPNDVVQQEVRRTLASEALTGKPLLMAEHFDADTAWSLVWVNPLEASATGTKEAALAARVYQRAGAVDWHGFARQGEHTGTSLGAAVSWVASDAVELHASLRAYQHVDSSASTSTGNGLSATNPWQATVAGAGQQVLVGGTWTNEARVSLLLEAWHDDTALRDSDWSAWTARNQALPHWLARRVPVSAVAGNLAWQANAFGVSSSLRQDNIFARLSWQHDRWQPALDVLYTPADQAAMVTASLLWSGERLKLEAGLRAHFGPDDAVLRQLPVQRQGYAVVTWAF